MTAPSLTVQRIKPRSSREQLRKTIELVGQGVRAGSSYFPIRQYAAGIATKAPPKDYLAQLRLLYDDFTKNRWRYVRDPLFAELVHIDGKAIVNDLFGAAMPRGIGAGDCDCATAAFGAAAASIGFPVRLVTSTPITSRSGLPGHIYPEIFVSGPGLNRWIPADPVVYPQHGLGYHTPAIARQRWDLWGRKIAGESLAGREVLMLGDIGNTLPDYGLERYGYAGLGSEGEPQVWGEEIGPIGFGAYADDIATPPMGGFGMFAEVETDDRGLSRTPMIELNPRDYAYIRKHGTAYHGMCGLGDDGSVYQYSGLSGFFSKIFKGAKKLIGKAAKGAFHLAKKVGKGVWKGTKAVLKHLPGGKYLVKFVNKLHSIAMKLVKPLMKIVGPLAKKIAPIAAMIPGYGPVISAALYAGGTVAQEMAKHGVKQDKHGRLHFPNPKAAHAFRAAMKEHAKTKREDVRAQHKAGKSQHEIIFGRKPVSPGHLPAGSPQHAAALHVLGVKRPGQPANQANFYETEPAEA